MFIFLRGYISSMYKIFTFCYALTVSTKSWKRQTFRIMIVLNDFLMKTGIIYKNIEKNDPKKFRAIGNRRIVIYSRFRK